MRKARILPILGLLLLVSTGCGTVADEMVETTNSVFPIGERAFVPIVLSPLERPWGAIKIPFIVLCVWFAAAFYRKWQEHEGNIAEYVEGSSFWGILTMFFGGLFTVIPTLDKVGRALWLVKTFSQVRDGLGWEHPLLEGKFPSGDVNPGTILYAQASIPLVCIWHAGWEVVIIILLPIAMVLALWKKSWEPLKLWFVTTFLWAFFGVALGIILGVVKAYRGPDANLVTSTLRMSNAVFVVATVLTAIIFSLIQIKGVLAIFRTLPGAVGEAGRRMGGLAWEGAQAGALWALAQRKGNGRGDARGGRGSGGRGRRDGGQLPPAKQSSKRKRRPPGEPKTIEAKGGGRPEAKDHGKERQGGRSGGKQQLPTPSASGRESKDELGQPETKGGGKKLPEKRQPGEHEAKANKISDQTGGVAKGAIATAGGPVGAAAAAAADKLPQKPSTLQSAGKATDRAKKTLRSVGEPLPPSRPAGGGQTGTYREPPTGENREASFEPQVVEREEPTSQIRATEDYADPNSGIVLCRDGQILHGNWTADGLETEGGTIPWDVTDVGEEVS